MGFAADSILFSFAVFDTGVIILILYFSVSIQIFHLSNNYIFNPPSDNHTRKFHKKRRRRRTKTTLRQTKLPVCFESAHPWFSLVSYTDELSSVYISGEFSRVGVGGVRNYRRKGGRFGGVRSR